MWWKGRWRSLVVTLTLILLTWRIWWAPNNANKWQIGFNSAFKGNIDWRVWRTFGRKTHHFTGNLDYTAWHHEETLRHNLYLHPKVHKSRALRRPGDWILYGGLWYSLALSLQLVFAFRKLQKASISFVIFVGLSVRVEQLGSHWTDFHEIW